MTDDKVTSKAQVKAQGREARCAPEQGIRGDAPDVANRYCNDCAWPYECAAAKSCRRRDMGEVRSEDCSALLPDRFGAPARSLVPALDEAEMVTMTNPGLAEAILEKRRRYTVGRGVVSIKTEDGWVPVGQIREPEREAAPPPLPRGTFELSGTITIRKADAFAGFSRFAEARIRRAFNDAVKRSADEIRHRWTRPPLDVPADWLRDAAADYEQGQPLLIGYDLAASPSDAQAHEQGDGAGASGRAERDPDNRAEQAGGVSE